MAKDKVWDIWPTNRCQKLSFSKYFDIHYYECKIQNESNFKMRPDMCLLQIETYYRYRRENVRSPWNVEGPVMSLIIVSILSGGKKSR